MRFERKYKFYNGHIRIIPNFLLHNGFREIYTKRQINSIYYDTDHLKLFFESENGYPKRNKIRLRFYNEDYENLNIEYKKKEGMLNKKDFFKISFFEKNILPVIFIDNSINNIKLVAPKDIEKVYKPKIMVNYTRRYFISQDKSLRLTIDYKINFMKASPNNKHILIGHKRLHSDSVIELKYEENYYPDLEFLDKLTNEFNLILSRSSKYALGIISLQLV